MFVRDLGLVAVGARPGWPAGQDGEKDTMFIHVADLKSTFQFFAEVLKDRNQPLSYDNLGKMLNVRAAKVHQGELDDDQPLERHRDGEFWFGT